MILVRYLEDKVQLTVVLSMKDKITECHWSDTLDINIDIERTSNTYYSSSTTTTTIALIASLIGLNSEIKSNEAKCKGRKSCGLNIKQSL